MVRIEEDDEYSEPESSYPENHNPHPPPSSDHRRRNNHPSSPTPSPPHSSSSSISSEHTFHGFSPLHQNPAPPAVANRLVRDQPESITKTESDAETGITGKGGGIGRRERRFVGSVLSRARYEKIAKRTGLGLRVCEIVVCLLSFSVMAADKNRGWALDSFDRYIEFRYSMSVNVIGFAYSLLQGLDLLIQLTTGKNLSHSKLRCYFDFAMDQILAYLLLSASTSAFTRVDDWISNWGRDKFPAMASASVGVSFLAFAAFALSSLVSGYILCTHR